MSSSTFTDLSPAATRVLASSRFVARLAQAAGAADPVGWLLALGADAWTPARLATLLQAELANAAAEADVARALRRVRQRLLPGLVVRDAAQVAPLTEIVGAMTAFAELAVQRLTAAIAADLAQRHGVPLSSQGVPQDLLVVAMGKGGGVELNVSSDLDLIFVYDEDGETGAFGAIEPERSALSHQEFFERLGKRLIAALSEVTSDGFVFRVDMRLRPNGDSGPLVVSTAMLE
jgi:glutamate-ammonia-ligase adenylyltransferase